ncbi:MAG: hypothetical protein KDN22_33065 [Verrucomicrobiae bacterium]|nr:hypothetical protein [Verrucomicrobiae bacterium]
MPSTHPTITTQGGLLPAEFLAALLDGLGKDKIPGLKPSDYHLPGSEKPSEAINRAWNYLRGRWEDFHNLADGLTKAEPGTGKTRDAFLLPLFRELGYGQLEKATLREIDGREYPVSHHYGATPIHLLGVNVEIDRRNPGIPGAAKMSPHAMVQEFLNRSDDNLWAFLTNGYRLRILRDNVSLTRQAFIEFDLFQMFENGEYADFQLLWLLCHQSRVEGTPPETCWLEKWVGEAKQRGVRMLEGLRSGVEQAINELGAGFLAWPGNADLRARLSSRELTTQDYYRQVLRIVYRLIFLFVAEDRDLLLDPNAPAEARERS